MLRGVTFETTCQPRHLTWLASQPHRMTARLVWQPEETANEYAERCRIVGGYADILACFCDSTLISALTPEAYRTRAIAVASFRKGIPGALIAEVGNELGGDWLGPDDVVFEKARAAEAVFKEAGIPTAATFYLDGNNLQRLLDFARAANLRPDYALISWYPNWTPGVRPDWHWCFKRLESVFLDAGLGIAEFGPQPARWTPARRMKLIRGIHAIRPRDVNWCGFYGYWNGSTASREELKVIGETLA